MNPSDHAKNLAYIWCPLPNGHPLYDQWIEKCSQQIQMAMDMEKPEIEREAVRKFCKEKGLI